VATVTPIDHRDRTVAAALVDLQRASYRVEADLIGFDGIPPLHETVDDVVALDLSMLGAYDGTLLAGALGYARDGDLVDIDRLAVHPSCFRRGIASRLVDALHERERDATRFVVSTGDGNTPAIACYERHGYEQMRTELLPEGVRVVRLARDLRTA
jgi:ribosomal protein S18 acetylase RimI-like enzyme